MNTDTSACRWMSDASKVLAENEVLIITCWQPRATLGPSSLSFTYTWLKMSNLMDSSIHTYCSSGKNVLHIHDICSQVCDSMLTHTNDMMIKQSF